jgi:archaellum biogenesis ATPase FlaH
MCRQPNSKLNTAQEAALKQFLDHIDSIGFSIRKSIVWGAANAILAQNYTPLYDKEPPTIGLH